MEQINAAGRVYIFGGGHVAQELEPVLSHVGFRCVVLDDRPEFTRRELFPTAEEIRLVDFNRLSDFVTLEEEDYVCVMTRGTPMIQLCRPRFCGRSLPMWVSSAAGPRQPEYGNGFWRNSD